MTVITGSELANSAFSDVKYFFRHSTNFRIKRRLDVTNMRGHAKYIGSNDKARIELSDGFCSQNISSLEDYFFSLIIVSHELAHYLNFHNSHRDTEELDSVAIEARADHFGALIFITLITFGKSTKKNIFKIDNDLNQVKLISSIGSAISSIHKEIFQPNHSELYPDPDHRAYLLICGCLSFFNRFFYGLNETWTMYFLMTILRSNDLGNQLKIENSDEEKGVVISNKIFNIHKKIQSENKLMVNGLKYKYGYFLSSNFEQTQEERTSHKEELDKMISSFNLFS